MLISEIKKIFRGESLSEEESRTVIKKIYEGERSDVQIAVLLTLLTQRGPSVEELIGFAKGMRDKTVSVGEGNHLYPLLDTCGTGGDGLQTFNVSTLAAFIVSASGVNIAKHGNRSITSKCGSADLLEGLGVSLDLPLEKIIPCLETVGIAFFFAPLFHPIMKILGPIRKQMGIPTLFNSMGPLLNPLGANYQVMGIYYPDTEKIARVLQALGIERGMVVHGQDGMDEISPCTLTQITEFTSSDLHTYDFDPREYGYPWVSSDEILGGSLEKNLSIAREVLNPQIDLNPRKQLVILNAAAGIRIVKGGGFQEALAEAKDILQSGAAQRKLEALVEFTHR